MHVCCQIPTHGPVGSDILLIPLTPLVKTWHWPWSHLMEIAETYPFPLGFQMTDAYYLSIVSLVLSTLTVSLNYH